MYEIMMIDTSREIPLVRGDHRIDMSSFALEKTNLSFEIFDFLRQKLD